MWTRLIFRKTRGIKLPVGIAEEEGMALLLAMFFTLVMLVVGGALFYASRNFAVVTGSQRRYIDQLERVKGVARYVMALSTHGGLKCNNNATCSPNPTCPASSTIDLPQEVVGPYTITACLKGQRSTSQGEVNVVTITSSRNGTKEKVVVDFGFLKP